MTDKLKDEIVQVFNPRGWWVKINKTKGILVSTRKKPYKNIPVVKTESASNENER